MILRLKAPVMRAIGNTIRGARTEGSSRRQRTSLSRGKNVVGGIVKASLFFRRLLLLKQRRQGCLQGLDGGNHLGDPGTDEFSVHDADYSNTSDAHAADDQGELGLPKLPTVAAIRCLPKSVIVFVERRHGDVELNHAQLRPLGEINQ